MSQAERLERLLGTKRPGEEQKSGDKFHRYTTWVKECQRIDGWPWEAGIYTFNSEGPGLEAAQLRYNNFLKRMQLRKNFRILQQNMTTFFNGVSIFVTYQIDDTPVEDN